MTEDSERFVAVGRLFLRDSEVLHARMRALEDALELFEKSAVEPQTIVDTADLFLRFIVDEKGADAA